MGRYNQVNKLGAAFGAGFNKHVFAVGGNSVDTDFEGIGNLFGAEAFYKAI